ncbi:hypothetical protein ECA02_31570 [Enterococcus casseliflavus]|nr:hypothetical protein ECA02_31570 [Enterococcus casseliflavus]
MHPDYLNYNLNTLSKKLGHSKITPHGLRHTFVSDFLNNGVDDIITTKFITKIKKHLPKNWKVLETVGITTINVLKTVKLYELS